MRNVLLLILLAWCTAHPAAAQQTRLNRVPVTVAFADRSTVGDAAFRILRRSDVAPHDVILLVPGASANALSEAVAELQTMRRVQGDTVSISGTMRVRLQGNSRGPRMLPWAPRVLQDLRRGKPQPLTGVGTVPSVQIWLPPTRRSGRAGT